MARNRRIITDDRALQSLQDASSRALRKVNTDFPYGNPTEIQFSDYNAKFGELVLINPTNAPNITLPTISKDDIGKPISVLNTTNSQTAINIRTTDGAYINSDFSASLQQQYRHMEFLPVSQTQWVIMYGKARWEDLRFPAQAINPPGTTSDPDRGTTTGLLMFSPSSTELVSGVAQMPHSWMRGTGIRPHIHISGGLTDPGTTNNQCVWQLDYEWLESGEYWSPATYTHTDTKTFTLPAHVVALNPVLCIRSFDEIDTTGKKESALLLWKLSRLGGDVDDTYIDDCYMYEFDIHYLAHDFGSEIELPT